MQAMRSVGIVLAILCGVSYSPSLAQRPLRPHPLILASTPADLIDRLRADPFTYFRFINRAWTERVCEAFADLKSPTIVRLHGDAHVEQFALTKDAWGLDDFDDSTRGPAFIDVVRFLGSLDLASRQRDWSRARDRLWTRFFEGYRLGLSNPDFQPREPEIVGRLRRQAPVARAAYLEWGERQMQPVDEARSAAIVSGMEAFERLIRAERPDLAPGYFAVKRAGWLRMGVGSATIRKILMRVSGPTADPDDDVLLEGKEVVSLEGVRCLETPTTPPAIRVIAGARQLGRLKHDILAVAPARLLPAAADHAENWLDWWISSWEPTYREVRLNDLRSAEDLADIAFVSGWQLGVGKVPSIKSQELSSYTMLESRLRKETSLIVEELLAGWRELARRR
jgi:Uncharacterized protein conserved in bacteria (DUF2252)